MSFFCIAYHSSVTKVTIFPALASRYYYSTTKELKSHPTTSILDNIIPFRQQDTSPFNQWHETDRQLIKNIQIFAPYLSYHLYDIENNEIYNKYKWKTPEKNAMANALSWMDKKPASITTQDLVVLSFLVKTRSPVQCRRFLQYRIKNKMTGFV